jgi:ribosomal protein L11 methyltransferase
VTVPSARAELARARMIELFPQGFEEIDQPGGVELVAYTDPSGEERLWHAFGGTALAQDVANGWEERWREFHRPVRVGPVWIGQPWQEPPEDAIPVVIDPGRAFGTGAHATTRLCVELLLGLEPAALLDVGCGSGVLSIAAAKLGFGPIVAIDEDEQAVSVTRANAEANGVDIEVRRSDALREELPAADVVVANITHDVVEAVGARARADTIITSGYLAGEDLRIPAFDRIERLADEGWAADLHVRRA